MIILITGASHTGKTALTPLSDDQSLTDYLWPIVREMIKTAIENDQNLVVEGCYIPFNWAEDFEKEYLDNIRFYCLVMSSNYIDNHFDDIRKYANVIENRMDDEYCTLETVHKDNAEMLEKCIRHGIEYILIEEKYQVDIERIFKETNNG